jgi:hypothetical protein
MDDHNETLRKAWLARLSEYVDTPQERRQRQIDQLGERWILHPVNAPQRGTYNPLTGKRLS